jgi:hypothetical protein
MEGSFLFPFYHALSFFLQEEKYEVVPFKRILSFDTNRFRGVFSGDSCVK